MNSALMIEWARPDDHEALIAMLLRCFAVANPTHPPFADLMPDIYQPSATHVGWNLVGRLDGTMVGCVGVYPVLIAVDGKALEIGGLGGVCCVPEHRGQGVMTQLLDEATRRMRHERQYPFAWLAGDRRRYQPWGYERTADSRWRRLSPRGPEVKHYAELADWALTVLPAVQADSDLLWRELATIPYFAACGRETLLRKYRRIHRGKTMLVIRAENAPQDRRGHVLMTHDGAEICGWGGDRDAVAVAVARHIIREQISPSVIIPPMSDDYCELFEQLRVDSSLLCTGNWAVLDMATTLNCFLAHLTSRANLLDVCGRIRLVMRGYRQCPDQAAIIEANGRKVTVNPDTDANAVAATIPEVRLKCWEMVDLLFSPVGREDLLPHFDTETAWVTGLLPLPVYLPTIYHV